MVFNYPSTPINFDDVQLIPSFGIVEKIIVINHDKFFIMKEVKHGCDIGYALYFHIEIDEFRLVKY